MPKKTVEAIAKSKNKYLISVKGNQPQLLEQVKNISEDVSKAESVDIRFERNKGRDELRETYVFNATGGISPDWLAVNLIIKVIRTTVYKGEKTQTTSYFISSLTKTNAFNIGQIIRKRWGIESNLHYIKDVDFLEDKLRMNKEFGSSILSVFRSIIINLFNKNGYKKIRHAMRLLCNDIKAMLKLILE